MKTLRKILFAVVALLPMLALGAAGDTKISQKNSSNTAWIDRIFAEGTAGYMLTTNGDGSGYAWVAPATSGPLPSQTGNSGKVLTTNGTNASWASVVTGLNSVTSASATDLTLTGNGGAVLTVAKATGDGTSPVSTLTSVFSIGGGSGTYIDYLLKINGWAANTRDAGIGLFSFNGGSPLVDFISGDSPSGKGRIGRNNLTGAALFVGAGGDTPSGFQIGTRDGTAVQLFTSDISRVFVTSGGLVGIGAFSNASQPDTLLHVLGAAKITGLLTGQAATFSSSLGVSGLSSFTAVAASGSVTLATTLNFQTSATTRATFQASGVDMFLDTISGGALNIRTLGPQAITLKTANTTAVTIDGSTQAVTLSSTITTLGGATFHTTSTALTNGAGVGVGTLTTAPSAGNPTKWIGINDNGTTRYIPAW